jgi:catechol 2,3-dioxygenase-like lactoylglutathione lyase family enzyme
MARVRYIAILAQDPKRLAAFYRDTLGMRDLGESPAGDVSLTDGAVNLTLFRLRPELGEAWMEQGFHHIGIEVDSIERAKARFRRLNPRCVIVPEVGGIHHGDVRFHDPEYIPVSLSQMRFGVPDAIGSSRRLSRIGFDVLDPAATCEFYVRVFGFTEQSMPAGSGAERPDRMVSDGYITLGFHNYFSAGGSHRPRYGLNHLRFAGEGTGVPVVDPEDNQIELARIASPAV